MAVLMVTHRKKIASLCDRVYVLKDGILKNTMTGSEIFLV